ncbi:efflux RND transporter periplasmic adaptor subunit [Nitrospina watsonii]|uniref:Cobalt/zinc/cadmium efflux RND transporter, membrane fusion protein, CzcB family n=1 Tax=Nitrospina watsonii TaxID=1323948 RepID=A0ABM9HH48_9BACT|nr:efflux RND transporter periplasmic adaptor subunit [Nitrospina watsonii]CAI2719655.1 Cobalt/zinc/cadmium efflux RND transporter, membrane fusion protein, CzcB family [Nitrospina watsonii]
MKRKSLLPVATILILGAAFGWAIVSPETVPFLHLAPHEHNDTIHKHDDGAHGAGDDHDDHASDMPRGPHNGMLFTQDDLQLEVVLYEQGVPPEFRVYPMTADGTAIPLEDVTVQIDLKRMERTDAVRFKPVGQYLLGDEEVVEPHSFVMQIQAMWNGKEHRWTHEQIEFRVEIPEEQADNAGIAVAEAGPRAIGDVVTLDGEIGLDEKRVAHIVPRVESLVVDVYKDMGDSVNVGDLLAVLQSRELADAKNEYLAAVKQAKPVRLDHERQKLIFDNTLIMLDLLTKNLSLDDLYSKIDDLFLGHSRAQIVPAYAKRVRTQAVYEREKTLYEKKISSRAEYLLALEEFQTAKAQYAASREQVHYQGKLSLLEKTQALEMAELNIKTQAQKLRTLGLTGHDIERLTSASPPPFTHYELRSEIAGTVIDKHIAVGEAIKKDFSVFMVADLSEVWVNIAIPSRDMDLVELGQKIQVRAENADMKAVGKLFFLGAVLDEKTRTVTGRIVIPNDQLKWRPGTYVKVDLIRDTKSVPVAVPVKAVQTFRDWDVVFIKVGNQYEPRPVKLGHSDGHWVEIVEGLRPDDTYVKENSFIIKAELQKSAATHSH